jgi:hypothetical protein
MAVKRRFDIDVGRKSGSYRDHYRLPCSRKSVVCQFFRDAEKSAASEIGPVGGPVLPGGTPS